MQSAQHESRAFKSDVETPVSGHPADLAACKAAARMPAAGSAQSSFRRIALEIGSMWQGNYPVTKTLILDRNRNALRALSAVHVAAFQSNRQGECPE
jgi:hypothetical protein